MRPLKTTAPGDIRHGMNPRVGGDTGFFITSSQIGVVAPSLTKGRGPQTPLVHNGRGLGVRRHTIWNLVSTGDFDVGRHRR
jgi:hypothetical protein